MADKNLKCRECGASFVFTEKSQAFFKEKGFRNEPQRCPACSSARKQQGNSSSGNAQREMYPAVCAECGKSTTVPFKPNNDKPVYCSDCFKSRRK